ncbi:PadR family transcriptional regulator [Oceanobacillus polygoni]|uniref:DNA-binding PadR family transcriptional regulator n=1 Tax=Oceanobacillus polygoni TaxID=1235259 RepID=A0A9X0YTC7_9BACI|nr:PadR family transcriptional regulator [Oceanobacillus polygoni]MBP2078482.1 DNA-binding PadR family transcriptional regulator [Oceanobacillus polygoni]
MKKYNHTTYTILGILTTDCRSGYAIKQFIDRSLRHFWKISYGQIYPTLRLIADEGLATVQTTSQDGKPDRNEYFLTPKGKSVLTDWLEKPIEEIPVERNEVLLKLFFGRHQSKKHTLQILQNYQQKLEERYLLYSSIEKGISTNSSEQQDAQYWLFTLDYGKRITRASIDWCKSTINQIS